MWREPYLETCCRSALHRVTLAGPAGRPPGLSDNPCLVRLSQMGLVQARADHRFIATADGLERHRTEVAMPAAARPG